MKKERLSRQQKAIIKFRDLLKSDPYFDDNAFLWTDQEIIWICKYVIERKKLIKKFKKQSGNEK